MRYRWLERDPERIQCFYILLRGWICVCRITDCIHEARNDVFQVAGWSFWRVKGDVKEDNQASDEIGAAVDSVSL